MILYFYPKDDTPGCTQESCDFQAALPQLKRRDAVVLGVSILDEASKSKFATKHGLTFPLLADANHEVAEKYGVWQQKSRYGRSHGDRADDISDWARWQGRRALGQREGGRAR